MPDPAYLKPFVVPVVDWPRSREGNIDIYRPDGGSSVPRPAVLFVHGGPVPAEAPVAPRDWPVYRGYGSLAASRGLVGVVVEHRLARSADLAGAAEDVTSAVARVRDLDFVDGDRVGLWFFSAGGPLSASWLAEPPVWLRCVALSYPLLAPPPGTNLDARFHPVEAIGGAGSLPLLLTRVGRERAEITATVNAFMAAAHRHRVAVDAIEIRDGQHGFDVLDHNDRSRSAVTDAMSWVTAVLTR